MKRTDIKQLWNNLTDYTHTYGQEDEVIKIIKDFITIPFEKDSYGNYFVKVGNSETLFLTHLDNAVKQKLKVTKEQYKKDGRNFVKTDGFTILGADDKTGIVMMINLIDNNVPGMYYFFIGEEVGLVGSILHYKEKTPFFSNFKRCISLDRKGYGSIINRMKGQYCCSNVFVDALSKEFSNQGMIFNADPTGVGTDSASFMSIIPECTNLSVGYFNEHTYREEQDIDYMLELSDVLVKIDWEGLPTDRIPIEWDTEKPDYIEPSDDHLPLYKLQNNYNELYRLLRSKLNVFSASSSLFEPGKEMYFYQLKDTENVNSFSLYVNWDGSVKIVKGDKVLEYDTQEEIKRILNRNNKKTRNLIGIVKLPHEILEDEERKRKLKEEKIVERIITKFEKFNRN